MNQRKSDMEEEKAGLNEKPAVPFISDDGAIIATVEVQDDEIMLSIKDDDSPNEVLKACLYGLGEEQNALKRLREDKAKEGKDTSHISIKRGTLLKYMTDALIQKQSIAGPSGEIDLRGPKFREVFKMFIEIISNTFDEVHIPPEYKELFFTTLSKNFEGWEERAEKIVKSMQNASR